MSVKNLYTQEGFFWWVGVVESRNDPLFLGRCKVRIFGYHTSDLSQLPTDDLPWCAPIQPITSAAISGIGSTPLGPVEGSWVVGFFLDGEDCQQPVMFGTIGGAHNKEYVLENKDKDEGFKDPNKKYPLQSRLNRSDVNRLALGIASETIIPMKNAQRIKNVKLPFDLGEWSEPDIVYAAKYPFNHVIETESGHTIELDDTAGAERIHVYHKSGTYVEITPTGSMIRKVKGNSYEIVTKNNNISIAGAANISIGGSANVTVASNCNIEVDGDVKIHSHNNIELKAAKNITLAAGKDINIQSKEEKILLKSEKPTIVDAPMLKLAGEGAPVLEVPGVIKGNAVTGNAVGPSTIVFINERVEQITEFPNEKKDSSVDYQESYSDSTVRTEYNEQLESINLVGERQQVLPEVEGDFPFDARVTSPIVALQNVPIELDGVPSVTLIPEMVPVVDAPVSADYIADDTQPITENWLQVYNTLKSNGWAGRRVNPKNTTVKLSDLKGLLAQNGISGIKARVAMAMMIREQGRRDSISASHYNWVGVTLNAGAGYRFNSSQHLGWNVLTEGTGKLKAFPAFKGVAGLCEYLKRRIPGNITDEESFANWWYTDYNGFGARTYGDSIKIAKAAAGSTPLNFRAPLKSGPWVQVDTQYIEGAKSIWKRTAQYFPEL